MPDVGFEDFVRAERSALIWFLVTQHTATLHEAEEAAQMAFIHAWRRWKTLTNPHAWVRTVAVREYLRSSPSGDPRRARQVEFDESVQPWLATMPSTAETVTLSDRERLVCAELAKLPPTQRAVAALRYEGYSNREIAELLGVDQSAVRHNVLRARSRLQHLRALMQEDAG